MEFGVTPQGYHYVRAEDGGTTTIHRLVAVAEHGYDAVVGNDVHHKDGVLCLNSRENVEPVSKEDHARNHIEDEYGDRAYRDEDVLRELYVERGLSTTQVAERLDCSHQTVNDWLREHGIELRKKSRWEYYDTENDVSYRDEDVLRELYVENNLSTYDLADKFDVSRTTISRWLERHSIGRAGDTTFAEGDV